MNKKLILLSAATLLVVGCKDQVKSDSEKETHGIALEYMDTSVKPGDDFFRYVNGKWSDDTNIPSDRTSWGSFDELRQKTDKDVLSIIKEAANDQSLDPNSDQAKAVAIYQSYLDTETRNKLGIEPLKPYLEKINAINSIQDVNNLMNYMVKEKSLGLYNVYVYADSKDSNKNSIYLVPGSIGLPDRDYYVLDDVEMKEKREKYVEHIARMLQFVGVSKEDASAQAKSILAFETKMAKPRMTRVERRDASKRYNPMSLADLQKITPIVDWEKYISSASLENIDYIIVSDVNYTKALQSILKNTDIKDIKAYLTWTLINSSSNKLTTDIETANWDFYSKTLYGVLEQKPIEERAISIVNSTVGEALGKLYVDKKFPAEAKEKAKIMVDNVLKAFENRIENISWMTDATKNEAIKKIKKTNVKIGYPDKWEDYSKLEIKSPKDGGNYFENMKNYSLWSVAKNIEDYGKAVDKTRWGMPPQMVNAYFNPAYNEIVFPAAILQAPFYDYKADEAVNYGGIGAVIGHEISHSFDDSGARYNADGNLQNWWTDEDLSNFTKLADDLATQYSALEPLPGVFVDGKFTLGENIGDLGGVNAAFDGLQLFLKDNPTSELIDGYTPNQRFFISWATIWRIKYRDEAIRNQVKTDPHSPGFYRAYVPLTNVDAFYDAFDIKKGDKLYLEPEDRVYIW